MTEEEWLKQLFTGLSQSNFRSRFHLKEQDKEYVRQKEFHYFGQHCTGGKDTADDRREL